MTQPPVVSRSARTNSYGYRFPDFVSRARMAVSFLAIGFALCSRAVFANSVPGRVVGWGSMALPDIYPTTVFTNISAGGSHGLAIRNDGILFAWGNNAYGECGFPTNIGPVTAISAGYTHSLAVRHDGTVIAWGSNLEGETTVPPGLSNVVAISAGGGPNGGSPPSPHSLALKSDGTVVGWGANYFGEATIPPGLSNVIAIAAGAYHSVALKQNRTVVAWGYDREGQADVPPGLTNVIAIAGGFQHSLALKEDGTVVGWGDSGFGGAVPVGLSNVVAIAAGTYHSLALKRDGSVVAWGAEHFDSGQANVPAGLTNVIAIAGGGDFSAALKADGRMVGWGGDGAGQVTALAGLTNVVAVDGGDGHSIALLRGGKVAAWGYNFYGQANVPAGLSNVAATAAGGYHSMALKSNGTVVAWGANFAGQADVPAGLSNVIAIDGGGYHSLALKQDGTVIGWGHPGFPFPDYGQASAPVGLSNVIAISAGWQHSLALKSDGTVVAWGDDSFGQCDVPAGLSNVIAITAGGAHSLALQRDGTLVGWGDDSADEASNPSGLSGLEAIGAGGKTWVGDFSSHSLAVKDGFVTAWGIGRNGETDVPVGLARVVFVSAGAFHSLAIVDDSSLYSGPLTLNSAGTGSVSPNLDGMILQFGTLYTITASPGQGFVLSNWVDGAGTVLTNGPVLRFLMESNLVLQANFIPNPFLPRAGNYAGLFYDTNSNGVTVSNAGYFTATLTASGGFTAKLFQGAKRFSLSGRFSVAGSWETNSIKGAPGLSVQLQLGSDEITGRISNNFWSAEIAANRAVYSSTNPAPQAGQYTIVMPGSTNSTALPGGHGAAAIHVNPAGVVKVNGTLGDGTAFTGNTFVSRHGQWPLYATPYSRKGIVIGWLTFTNDLATMSDMEGVVSWIKPPQTDSRMYPDGFDWPYDAGTNNAFGSAFTNRTPLFSWTNGVVILQNGNLAQSVTNGLVIGSGGKATGTNKLTLTIITSGTKAGLFKGSVTNPTTGKSLPVRGALLQKQDNGYGDFSGTNQSGSVFLRQ